MRHAPAWALALLLLMPASLSIAAPDPSPAGRYRATDGPELAAQLILLADGRFRYDLSVGALDELAEGRWDMADGTIRLTTQPTPKAPAFTLSTSPRQEDAPFLIVRWPNGAGIAGIDFRLHFASGPPIEDYTQQDGWRLPPDETRMPVAIELAEPIHNIVAPRFALKPGDAVQAVLVPNDLGVIPFSNSLVERDGERLTLHRPDGARLHFMRVR